MVEDRADARADLDAFLDAGFNFVDTADVYSGGVSEEIIGRWLADRPADVTEAVVLATKGGHVRTEGGGWATDSSAAHLTQAVDDSLRRLGVEQIALWQHHRPSSKTAYEDVLATMQEIAASGKVRMLGISNANPEQIRAAHAALGAAWWRYGARPWVG